MGCGSVKPSHHLHYIDRRRNQDMLQMRFRQGDIACSAQVESMHPLRQCAFNASPTCIRLLELPRCLVSTGRLEDFIRPMSGQSAYGVRCSRGGRRAAPDTFDSLFWQSGAGSRPSPSHPAQSATSDSVCLADSSQCGSPSGQEIQKPFCATLLGAMACP